MNRLSSLAVLSAALVSVLTAQVTTPSAPVGGVSASAVSYPPGLECEIVTVNDYGAYPATITRKPGPFYLVIRNSSLKAPVALTLDSPNVLSTLLASVTQALNLPLLANVKHLIAPIEALTPG